MPTPVIEPTAPDVPVVEAPAAIAPEVADKVKVMAAAIASETHPAPRRTVDLVPILLAVVVVYLVWRATRPAPTAPAPVVP